MTVEPTAVLLHGQPGSAADWRRVRDLLDGRCRVLAIDRPGYGRSDAEARSIAGNARAVLDVLDAHGLEAATVAGYSFGGAVALWLAEHRPERVRSLVLVASVGHERSLGPLDRLLALPGAGEAVSFAALGLGARALALPALLRPLERVAPSLDTGRLHGVVRGWGAPGRVWRSFVREQRALVRELPELAERLGGVRAPTTVVIGKADRVVSADAGRALAAAIPGARVVEVEGAGHLLLEQAPAAVADAIAEAAAG